MSLDTAGARTMRIDVDMAKKLWNGMGPNWHESPQLGDVMMYVHRKTAKSITAFYGVASGPADAQTPDALLRFHIIKRRRAFHVGYSAFKNQFKFRSEEDRTEFTYMTEYMHRTYDFFKAVDGFLFGKKTEINGVELQFPALTVPISILWKSMLFHPEVVKRKQMAIRDPGRQRCESITVMADAPVNYAVLKSQPAPTTDSAEKVYNDFFAMEEYRDCEPSNLIRDVVQKLVHNGYTIPTIKEKVDHVLKLVASSDSHGVPGAHDREVILMIREAIVDAVPDYYGNADLPNEDEIVKQTIDSITPGKRQLTDQIKDDGKVLVPMVGNTPEMRNLLQNRIENGAGDQVPALCQNGGKRLENMFDDCKTPGSNLSTGVGGGVHHSLNSGDDDEDEDGGSIVIPRSLLLDYMRKLDKKEKTIAKLKRKLSDCEAEARMTSGVGNRVLEGIETVIDKVSTMRENMPETVNESTGARKNFSVGSSRALGAVKMARAGI